MRRIAVFAVLVMSVSIGAVACADKSPIGYATTRDSTVYAVSVSPQNATVRIREQVQLTGNVNAGALVVERSVIWSSSNATIGSVNAAGLVTAGTVTGTVTITAVSKADTSIRGTAVITVSAAQP
ncbi:MAG TPA: Ig-like domain-containing protein [Gemmatimonadaceae bacterium]